ncbi:MAG: complex I subunit 4 family protein, partial [Armatimonadaceae bacterium]
MLSLFVAAPVVASLIVLALSPRVARIVTLLTTLLLVAFGTVVAFSGSPDSNGWRWVEKVEWFPALGISWHIGVDGLAGLLVWMTALLACVTTAAPVAQRHFSESLHWSMLLMATGLTIGAFVALDLMLFYIFFEACLIPVFIMMGTFGRGERTRAALVFLVYTLVASLVLLAGLIALRIYSGSFSWDVVRVALNNGDIPSVAVGVAFAGFLLAFAVKSPVFPFHSWLPDAYRCAPPATAILLAGAMAKLGTFGFTRFVLPLFPDTSAELAPLMVWLGVAGIVYGAMNAIAQTDLRSVVAFSSVSHLGYVIAGTFSGSDVSTDGAALQMVNHGVTVGALFLLVGIIESRWGTSQFDRLGGLWQSAPVLGSCLLLVALSAIALPLTNGFVGELLILIGLFGNFPGAAVVAVSGALLSAIYMLLAL